MTTETQERSDYGSRLICYAEDCLKPAIYTCAICDERVCARHLTSMDTGQWAVCQQCAVQNNEMVKAMLRERGMEP